jgi:DNA invertase Pin-like site-specific DNA recombinase
MEFVVYLRCSTGKQELSGLEIEAQQEAVHRYARSCRASIVAEYVETASGGKHDRAELAKALAHCRKTKATLLIARLDRLSRSLSFVAQLLDANVEIRCADMPEANRLLLQMLAVFGEHERQMIRDRTKAALAAAKARGVVLGRYGRTLAAKNRLEASQWAETVRQPLLQSIKSGNITFDSHAEFLNRAGIKSREGGRFHAANIARIMRRLNLLPDQGAMCAR